MKTNLGLYAAARYGSMFIVPGRRTMEDMEATWNVPKERLLVVWNGVDRELFHPVTDHDVLMGVRRKYGVPERTYFLVFGGLDPEKNLAALMQAFKGVIEAHPELDLHLVVVGREAQKCTALLADSALKSERVVFTGYVQDADLPALYSGARAFCCISPNRGFSLPAVEAMACGTPVILCNSGGMSNVVLFGGLTAEPGNVKSIRENMDRVLLDNDFRSSLVCNVLKRASLYSWKRTIEKTLDAYRVALKTPINGYKGKVLPLR